MKLLQGKNFTIQEAAENEDGVHEEVDEFKSSDEEGLFDTNELLINFIIVTFQCTQVYHNIFSRGTLFGFRPLIRVISA